LAVDNGGLGEDEISATGAIDFDDLSYDVSENARPLWHLLLRVLGRTPTEAELTNWVNRMASDVSAATFVRRLMMNKRVQETKFVRAKNPPGHFFSPVVDPDLVRDYVDMNRRAGPDDLGGITFDLNEMEAFWTANRDVIAATPFKDQKSQENRYYYGGGPYSYGDATTARAMIAHFKPKKVIEIGSGYSTACMLDAADHAKLKKFHITCIEPYPTRLKSVLRPDDIGSKVSLYEQGVQGMDLAMFEALEPNDILFIDSTHVLKTGSDVHYELFYIMPKLKKGVIVHFHDCRFPLEYSDIQIFKKNYSWNEAYGVRALLMYSEKFKVFFSGSLFARERRALVEATYPKYLHNPGSALWIRTVS
jgi:predicted O-methyltransferase YrrM